MSEVRDLPFLHTWDRNRYSIPWLMLCPSEDAVEKTILESLRFRGILAVKIDTGAKALRGRMRGALNAAGRADLLHRIEGKTSAGMAGLSDIVGVVPGGRALWIEVKQPEWLERSKGTGRIIQKRSEGKPEPDQLDFLERMARQGAIVGVAWSADDLGTILRRS